MKLTDVRDIMFELTGGAVIVAFMLGGLLLMLALSAQAQVGGGGGISPGVVESDPVAMAVIVANSNTWATGIATGVVTNGAPAALLGSVVGVETNAGFVFTNGVSIKSAANGMIYTPTNAADVSLLGTNRLTASAGSLLVNGAAVGSGGGGITGLTASASMAGVAARLDGSNWTIGTNLLVAGSSVITDVIIGTSTSGNTCTNHVYENMNATTIADPNALYVAAGDYWTFSSTGYCYVAGSCWSDAILGTGQNIIISVYLNGARYEKLQNWDKQASSVTDDSACAAAVSGLAYNNSTTNRWAITVTTDDTTGRVITGTLSAYRFKNADELGFVGGGGDITAVVAGVGLSGGGTSDSVTLNVTGLTATAYQTYVAGANTTFTTNSGVVTVTAIQGSAAGTLAITDQFDATSSSGNTCTNGVVQNMNATPTYNVGTVWDTSTDIITFSSTGWVDIAASCYMEASISDQKYVQILIRKNGTKYGKCDGISYASGAGIPSASTHVMTYNDAATNQWSIVVTTDNATGKAISGTASGYRFKNAGE